jgi:hypothetical protein
MLGRIQRHQELKKKVDTSFADIGKAQKAGDHSTASKAFRKHERYANLERPGTWTKSKEQGVAEGSSCNMTMEGKSCPMHGLKECPGYKSNIEETTAGSVATVVNPTPKNKSKVGTLFGGTYKQKKSK